MLFKARNPEMFLELVDFFSCKRFQRICHCLPTYAYERKNKDVATPMYHIFVFINVL